MSNHKISKNAYHENILSGLVDNDIGNNPYPLT